MGLALVIAAMMTASCVTTKKIAYLQDMHHGSQIELENTFEAVISPYDELDIVISCFDQELAKPFNIRSASQSAVGNSSNYGLSYLVDQYGDIELPVLGKIHAAGFTRLKLQEKISEMLVSGGYINDPFVMVRFRSFKIFFLGANGGKAITVSNERCTFLEALAMAGGLNQFTKRDRIAVMREENGKIVTHFLDPRSTDVFYDPFFLLQQNDIIVTQSFRRVYTQNVLSTSLSVLTAVTSLVSTIALVFVAMKE